MEYLAYLDEQKDDMEGALVSGDPLDVHRIIKKITPSKFQKGAAFVCDKDGRQTTCIEDHKKEVFTHFAAIMGGEHVSFESFVELLFTISIRKKSLRN